MSIISTQTKHEIMNSLELTASLIFLSFLIGIVSKYILYCVILCDTELF